MPSPVIRVLVLGYSALVGTGYVLAGPDREERVPGKVNFGSVAAALNVQCEIFLGNKNEKLSVNHL